MRNPRTRSEWQEAVDAAEAMLLVHGAQRYGLITGGPNVNADRCVAVLERARQHGIVPRAEKVEEILEGLAAGLA